jgi:hypothetical protein
MLSIQPTLRFHHPSLPTPSIDQHRFARLEFHQVVSAPTASLELRPPK